MRRTHRLAPKVLVVGGHPRRGTCSIHDAGGGGESDGASYCEPKKIHEPEILHPKKYKI